jgi:hypothetical protein
VKEPTVTAAEIATATRGCRRASRRRWASSWGRRRSGWLLALTVDVGLGELGGPPAEEVTSVVGPKGKQTQAQRGPSRARGG